MESHELAEKLHDILREQGYVVVGACEPFEIGELVDGDFLSEMAVVGAEQIVVLGCATFDEAERQSEKFGLGPSANQRPHYYRVAAE